MQHLFFAQSYFYSLSLHFYIFYFLNATFSFSKHLKTTINLTHLFLTATIILKNAFPHKFYNFEGYCNSADEKNTNINRAILLLLFWRRNINCFFLEKITFITYFFFPTFRVLLFFLVKHFWFFHFFFFGWKKKFII